MLEKFHRQALIWLGSPVEAVRMTQGGAAGAPRLGLQGDLDCLCSSVQGPACGQWCTLNPSGCAPPRDEFKQHCRWKEAGGAGCL